jgi:Ca2+-binding RTX toxin-like protein
VVGQARLIAVVGVFVIGSAVLLVVGCAGVRSEAPKEQEQGHAEATEGQARSPEARAPEQARCGGTRTTVRQGFHRRREDFLTNDLPGCPKGGPLTGTDKSDNLDGKEGDDEIRGHGERDFLFGGPANDVLYGGPGDDWWFFGGASNDVIHGGPGDDSLLTGGDGDDVIYGGDGHEGEMYGDSGADVLHGGDGGDFLSTTGDRQPDKLYCGEGKDKYEADKNDFVSSSCEEVAEWTVIY